MAADHTFPVVEIFGPTHMGEGTAAGMRSHFVRFGYCDALPTGPCRWCWVEGTRVLVRSATGYNGKRSSYKFKPIETIEPGEILYAWDGETDAFTTVERVVSRRVRTIVEIGFEGGRKVRCTPEHPLMQTNGVWITAENLRPGAELIRMHMLERLAEAGVNTVAVRQAARVRMSGDQNPAKRGLRGSSQSEYARIKTMPANVAVSNSKKADKSALAMAGRRASSGRASSREAYFASEFAKADLPLTFVGNGALWIGDRNPDFVVTGERKVIEIQRGGRLASERLRDLTDAGYEVLVLDEMKEPAELVAEVWRFIHNGLRVKYLLFVGGDYAVYDLHCEPHHNYYGEGLLSHNCDSMFAVDPKNRRDWTNMTAAQIRDRLTVLGGSKTVTLSGGNPCIYRLDDLVESLVWDDWTIWVETQGSIYREWLDGCHVTVSPKPPSAGRCDRAKLATFIAKRTASYPRFTAPRWSTIKIPIDPAYNNGVDFVFAESVLEEFKDAPFAPVLSVVTYPTDKAEDIIDRWRAVAEWAIDAPISDKVRTLPQLHVLLWSHARGV